MSNSTRARLAKPRGGRRPGALRPPASPSLGVSQQPQQNSINMNGTQQQPGGFNFGQQPNGNQPNQNSASFPPFPSSSFNAPFATPSSGFNFSVGQNQEVNNPFTAINTHNAPPPEPAGFQGSIFNLPPQQRSPYQKFLEGEQKPMFAPGAPDFSAAGQPQTMNNFFNQSTNQQQPSQTDGGMFPQPNTQQQPSNNAFGQSTEQKAPQPSSDIFAHLKTSQDQSSTNPFAQSIAQFRQSQSAQPAVNLFAHLGQRQPSSSFLTQGSTSPTQGEASMMQISPDPSPQSRPFGFLNQPNTQAQTSPTKDSSGQGGGGSLFDRISKPSSETNIQPQPSPTKDTTAQGLGASLFDRISKPSAETNAQSNAQSLFTPGKDNTVTDSGINFNLPQTPGTSKASNGNGGSSPTKIGERKIAKPTLFTAPSEDAVHPPYKAIFGSIKMPPNSQPSPSLASSVLSASPQPSSLQSKVDFASPSRSDSNVPRSSVSTQESGERSKMVPDSRHTFGAPHAPEGYSEEEARTWSRDWWISFYVRHKEKRIKHAESQCDERIKAVLDGVDPLGQIAGSKRKFVNKDRGGKGDDVQEKKARVDSPSIFTQEPRGASVNGPSTTQSPSKRDNPVQQVTNKSNKRSADDEPERENAHGTAENGKKARGHDPVSYPSLPAASPDSQTSSIFKNILDKKEEAKVNGTQNDKATPFFQFQAPSGLSSTQSPSGSKPLSTTSVPLSSEHENETPSKSNFGSFNPAFSTPDSSLFVNQQSTTNGAPAAFSTTSFKPSTSAAPLTTPNPNPFSFKPNSNSEAPSDTTKALAVAFSSGATTSTAPSPPTFSAKPTTSGQTSSEDAKAPAFKVPAFGAAPLSTVSNPSPFSIKPSTSGQIPSEAAKAPAFQVPKFGAGMNFMSQFGQAAEKTAAEEKKKRKAEDFDSDEEDLAEWEKRDAEEQLKKKQKLEEEVKGKAAKLIDGKWVITASTEKPSTSVNKAQSADPNVSVLSLPREQLTNGHNIFGHLSGEESGAEGSKTSDADDEDDERDERDEEENDDENNGHHQVRGPFDNNESDSESDEDEGQSKKPKAISNPFGATQNGLGDTPSRNGTLENTKGEDTGRSLFDRISRDKDGKPIREMKPADGQAASQTTNVFGQSFKSASSSNLFSQPSDLASSFTSTNSNIGDSPKGDHTWKVDSPIKFGESSNPPAVNVTSPSPSRPSFGGLFGAAKPSMSTKTPTKPASSISSTTPAKTPSVGFGFGFKPTTASLAPPSNIGSNTTSRANSPGATTGESANESTADGEDDKAEKQEQIDLTCAGPGEEDEDVVMQVKAKALKWDPASSSWSSKGVGPLRVLNNRESHQTRVLLRQDPSGRIVLNFALSKSFTYESSQSKTVRVPIVNDSGKIESWMIKVGNDDDAKKLASALEEKKT